MFLFNELALHVSLFVVTKTLRLKWVVIAMKDRKASSMASCVSEAAANTLSSSMSLLAIVFAVGDPYYSGTLTRPELCFILDVERRFIIHRPAGYLSASADTALSSTHAAALPKQVLCLRDWIKVQLVKPCECSASASARFSEISNELVNFSKVQKSDKNRPSDEKYTSESIIDI
jgi:hypothetical protein